MTNIKPYFTYGAKASDRDLVNSTVTVVKKCKDINNYLNGGACDFTNMLKYGICK